MARPPGHIASRGAISMNWRPSRLSMPPQLGTVVGSPNPRKLNDASAIRQDVSEQRHPWRGANGARRLLTASPHGLLHQNAPHRT